MCNSFLQLYYTLSRQLLYFTCYICWVCVWFKWKAEKFEYVINFYCFPDFGRDFQIIPFWTLNVIVQVLTPNQISLFSLNVISTTKSQCILPLCMSLKTCIFSHLSASEIGHMLSYTPLLHLMLPTSEKLHCLNTLKHWNVAQISWINKWLCQVSTGMLPVMTKKLVIACTKCTLKVYIETNFLFLHWWHNDIQ